MRAWWWVLITAHLVWGNPEQLKDDHGNTINLKTNQDSATEGKLYTVWNLKGFYSRNRRDFGGNEREKKQMRFHSWGGKRDEDEEEDEIGENSETKDIIVNESDDEDLLSDLSSSLSSNASGFKTKDIRERFREALTKRRESSPAFYPWGGKRDPEMMNDVSKRSNFFNPVYQKDLIDSNMEQTRKRYPSFSSWAGKRAAPFNSWGGKRDYPKSEILGFDDYNKGNQVYGFDDYSGNQVYPSNEHTYGHTSPNSDSLQFEDSLNFQNHDGDITADDDNFSKTKPEDNGHQLSQEGQFLLDFGNPISKRAAAFNSWGGKRYSEENQGIMKMPTSLDSRAGKRAAAFNSWGGKRVPAFNSWGGKRAAAFNSWGGKRAAAFNSWGGKRAPAFNSWGGKRAPAFNSWGGKRAVAFNSWGGKRAAAFNSWGGKRAAAFNSWGGKRGDNWNDNQQIEYPTWTINRVVNGVNFPMIKINGKSVETTTKELLHQIDSNKDLIFKHKNDNIIHKIKENLLKNICYLLLQDKHLKSVNAKEFNDNGKDNNGKAVKMFFGHSDSLEKRIRPSFSSWAGKRDPLFSAWYGGKMPAMLLTSGKRRPAFSSWGGKRSGDNTVLQPADLPESTEDIGIEDTIVQKPDEISPIEKTYTREKRQVGCCGEKKNSILTIERDKRASGNLLKNRVFTRMMLQGSWPMAFQSKSHGKDFFAWGGKRSFHEGTLR